MADNSVTAWGDWRATLTAWNRSYGLWASAGGSILVEHRRSVNFGFGNQWIWAKDMAAMTLSVTLSNGDLRISDVLREDWAGYREVHRWAGGPGAVVALTPIPPFVPVLTVRASGTVTFPGDPNGARPFANVCSGRCA